MLTEGERGYVRYMLAKKPARRHPYRGKWMTVAEIAAATGMSERTIQRRIQAGVDLDMPRRKPGPQRRRYEFRECSLSIKEIAALTGWSITKTRSRISGTSVLEGDDMHMTDLLKDNLVLLTFNKRTDTVAGWSQRLGITDATLRNRINRGWSIERALTEPPMRPNERFVFKHNRRIIRRIAASFHRQSYEARR
ncbi:hypothetical protein ABGN05_00070 [Aquibium sp. LZ166]|uniref:Uncharacterized protein n=1 Tax=Aquibium pacificus TaxID=3153579 RepID=A0ABV3SBD0_9HYPH